MVNADTHDAIHAVSPAVQAATIAGTAGNRTAVAAPKKTTKTGENL
jgi:hypothetical protein